MNKQPQWQPINMLSVFTDMVDGMLESSVEQLGHIRLAINKPHVLDDHTLSRMMTLYRDQLDDHWLFEEQFTRWQQGKLSYAQRKEIDRLIKQSSELKKTNEEIIKLVRSIEHATIDKIIAMDEVEMVGAIISGNIKPPG